MNDFAISFASALWLGLLTSLSPCPLATNIAAISYIGKRTNSSAAALRTGMVYAIGRMLAYTVLGLIVTQALFSVPLLSMWLQEYMNGFVGPMLVIAGMLILGVLNVHIDSFSLGDGFRNWLHGRAKNGGFLGAALLGFFFALSFCPVSAALFFGSLIPMALQHHSGLALPIIYGLGTAIPVLSVGMGLAFGGNFLGRALKKTSEFEIIARRLTGIIFVAIGLYLTWNYTLGMIF